MNHSGDLKRLQAEDYARGPWLARQVPGGLWATANGTHVANVYSSREDAEYWAAAFNYDEANN